MSEETRAGAAVPAWVGLVPFTMAMLILGAQLGVIPADDGAFFGPPWVMTSLWIGLLLFAAILVIPPGSPAWLRSLIGLGLLLMVGVVCNWSAFAPEVRYFSSTTIGPITRTGEDPIGGRIAFGLAALAVDAVLLGGLAYGVRSVILRIRRR